MYTQAQSQSVVNAIHPRWWYTYKTFKNGVTIPNGGRFIPFFPLPADCVDAVQIAQALLDAGPNGYFMVYGEIDLGIYSGITIADLATGWEALATNPSVVSAGIKLISPSMGGALSVGDRFDQFFQAVTNKPWAIRMDSFDGNPGHAPTTFYAIINNRIDLMRARYPGYPFVIAEYGFDAAGSTAPQIEGYMAYCVPQFDQALDVAMHFWWYGGPITLVAAAPYNPGALQLADDSAAITPSGAFYAQFCN